MNLLEAAQALANAEREVTRAEADLDEADKALQEASATYRSRNDWAFDARMERDAAIAKMRHLLSLASDEPASEQDAAPLPQPQTDAGSAQAATQGAGSGIESMEYVSSFPNNVTATPFIAPGSEEAQGLADNADFSARLDISAAYDAMSPDWPSIADSGPCEGVAGEPLNGTSLHPEHDGTGYWSGTVDGETP